MLKGKLIQVCYSPTVQAQLIFVMCDPKPDASYPEGMKGVSERCVPLRPSSKTSRFM